MRKLTLVLMVLALSAGFALAGGSSNDYTIHKSFYGEKTMTSAVKQDTTLAAYFDFSSASNPALGDMDGWTGTDLTMLDPAWHLDTYACDDLGASPSSGNQCAYAGAELVACTALDDLHGYGNSWNETLEWVGTVDESLDCTVYVDAYINTETEGSYDYLYLEYERNGVWDVFADFSAEGSGGISGVTNNMHVQVDETLLAGEYTNTSELHIRWRAQSDGSYSDADCNNYTIRGHSQVDDVTISFDQGSGIVQQSFDDFEGTSKVSNLGDNWFTEQAPYCGDFADVWDVLGDVDPCHDNTTPQIAFIDYGQIPGVGPSTNPTWTYGPNGYVVNYDGGLSTDPNTTLSDAVWSPEIAVDPAANGHEFRYSVYRHMDLYEMAGMFYTWNVRSSSDGGDTWTGWSNRNYVYYGGPDYIRTGDDVTDLIAGGADYVQLSLELYHWPTYGADDPATPAPYFDDVSWHTFDYTGPGISYREFELAQDNFPDVLDWTDLGGADVEFIMGNDLIGDDEAAIVHGDSIVLNIDAVRAGSGLSGRPRMYYEVNTNPVFDSTMRTSGVPYSGYVEGDTIYTASGIAVQGRWSFDLPDEDFLYPGDVMHYYFWAEDTLAGGSDPQTATLPGNLDGFGVFYGDPGYIQFQWPSILTLNALPTVRSTTDGDVPELFHFNDFGNRGGENEWEGAFSQMGMAPGVDYDVYFVNSPSSGTGNSIGSTATNAVIQLYDSILYTQGDLQSVSLNGPKAYDEEDGWVGDGSDDIAMMEAYIDNGGNFLGTGDGWLVGTYVADGTYAGATLVNTYFGVNVLTRDIRASIDNQSTPTVAPVTNGSGLALSSNFVAYGGCPYMHTFDGIKAISEANVFTVAEFLDPDGAAGAYTEFDAMVAKEHSNGAKTVVCPVDLSYWYTPYGGSAKANPADAAARTVVLCDILNYFAGNPSFCDPNAEGTTGAGTPQPFYAKNWPNPFNPATTIKFSVPRSGHVSLKVYNVRGELVRTLVDESRASGEHVIEWDGSDNSGKAVASGVYFYETRTNGESIVNKMALVK